MIMHEENDYKVCYMDYSSIATKYDRLFSELGTLPIDVGVLEDTKNKSKSNKIIDN